MKFYWLHEVSVPQYSGSYHDEHQWCLPGVHCPVCDAIWSIGGDAYPSVDLSQLPENDKYLPRLEKAYAEFERLREQACTKCGRRGWSLPAQPMLEAASLPENLDVFRVGDFGTVLVGSERFVEAVRHLGFSQDILFRELPLR